MPVITSAGRTRSIPCDGRWSCAAALLTILLILFVSSLFHSISVRLGEHGCIVAGGWIGDDRARGTDLQIDDGGVQVQIGQLLYEVEWW